MWKLENLSNGEAYARNVDQRAAPNDAVKATGTGVLGRRPCVCKQRSCSGQSFGFRAVRAVMPVRNRPGGGIALRTVTDLHSTRFALSAERDSGGPRRSCTLGRRKGNIHAGVL
jgi:hypothetical protein